MMSNINLKNGQSSGNKMALLEVNDTKAGMQGIDKEKVNQIVAKASQGSKFYAHKQRSQEKLDAKIEEIKTQMTALTMPHIKDAEKKMDSLACNMERNRDFSKTIVHIDMDAFYAAVEMRDDPQLRDKPMAVGSSSMLSTSNYEARKFGVRAAMPGFIAKKLCPELVIVPCNMEKYAQVSEEIRSIFSEYDSDFCPMSLDEAYLNLTCYLEMKSVEDDECTAESVVEEIRMRITEKTQLTASAGIACNTRLAKLCSDMNKPNGQFFLPPDRESILTFVRGLPIRRVGGIGGTTEQLLASVEIKQVSDLWEKRGLLGCLFSANSTDFFLKVSLGLGSTNLSDYNDSERKSMSCERTFISTNDPEMLLSICKELSSELSHDLQRKGLLCKAVTLKIKSDQFEVKTKVLQLDGAATNLEDKIFQTAAKILQSEIKDNKPCLRLMGVRATVLVCADSPQGQQQTLDSLLNNTSENKWECPICCKNIVSARTEHQRTLHVNKCLCNTQEDNSTSKRSWTQPLGGSSRKKVKTSHKTRTIDSYFKM